MNRKIYELPISKDYIIDWVIEDAIREVTQNAIDSKADGNELEINYGNGTLNVINYGCHLDTSFLVLGNTGKSNGEYIGKFGEGGKLALVVLLRNGLTPTIYTNGQKWVASFRKSRKFKSKNDDNKDIGIETLHIDVYEDDSVDTDIIGFEIKGLDYDLFKKIRSKNIAIMEAMGHSIGETSESEYGDILLNKDYQGMMFVEGLFIQEDSTFEYGYNFKSEYVKLDRDRKAINHYELKELTAKALSTQDNIEIVHRSISKSRIDTNSLENVIKDASEEFIDNFTNDFMNRHELEEDVFVGTEKEVELSGKENTFITTKVIAEIVHKGLNTEEEYEEVKQKIEGLSEIESAWNSYNSSEVKKLVNMVKLWKDRLTTEEINLFKKLMTTSWKFRTSYVDKIKEEIFKDFYPKEEKKWN